jgi:hypothetical protein
MPGPSGFAYTVRKNGEVEITHERRLAATLRGDKARTFLDQVATGEPQQLMARVTGNYKRGNERST